MKRYVVDTTSLISFYTNVFERPSKISGNATDIIASALAGSTNITVFIPTIVFVEIFSKFCPDYEHTRKIYYEVFCKVRDCERVELREFDEEVFETALDIDDSASPLEAHDKIVMATALALDAFIITSDQKIQKAYRAQGSERLLVT